MRESISSDHASCTHIGIVH